MTTEEIRNSLTESLELLESIKPIDVVDDARIVKIKRIQKRLLESLSEPTNTTHDNIYDDFFAGF